MDRRHKEALRLCHVSLLDDIDTSFILPYLYESGVITEHQREYIEYKRSNNGRFEAARVLLSTIVTCGPNAFEVFLLALTNEYPHLKERLEENLNNMELPEEDYVDFDKPEVPLSCVTTPDTPAEICLSALPMLDVPSDGVYFLTTCQNDVALLARLLRSMAQEMSSCYDEIFTESRKSSDGLWKRAVITLTSLIDVADIILLWLEKSANQDSISKHSLDMNESVCRGFTSLAEVGSALGSAALLRYAMKWFNVRHYISFVDTDREYIEHVLIDIEQKIPSIYTVTDEAAQILSKMLSLDEFHSGYARQFDNCIRQALLEIDALQERLKNASMNINRLIYKLNVIRWFHRFGRLFLFLFICNFLHRFVNSGAISSNFALFAGAASGGILVSYGLGEANALYLNIQKLSNRCQLLDGQLTYLTKKLFNHRDYKQTYSKDNYN